MAAANAAQNITLNNIVTSKKAHDAEDNCEGATKVMNLLSTGRDNVNIPPARLDRRLPAIRNGTKDGQGTLRLPYLAAICTLLKLKRRTRRRYSRLR